ncbi:MAG TPA: histidinol dehydrogenase [Chloroflexota bacterium]|nr:histidinol dehydrogenase [Chloroflexota bacterium]
MPPLRIVTAPALTAEERSRLFARGRSLDDFMPPTREIMDEVRAGGDAALLELTERFDGVRPARLAVTDAERREAIMTLSDETMRALEDAVTAIRAFHRRQLPREGAVRTAPGVIAWREWRPLERVGLYIPGGRAPLASSVLMLGVPAAIAGCRDVILCTPPGPDGSVPAATLAAAEMAGIHQIFKVGGAQAIAAMAYGTETIPPVQKVFGAGNRYVTAAKLLAFPACDIDLPAGPSELVIIGDETAPPAWLAADLLSNAEHGPDSASVLFTDSCLLAKAVRDEVTAQLATLPRRTIAERALRDVGLIVVTEGLEEAVRLTNEYAPEHLEIVVAEPRSLLPRITNAGSIFLGPYAPNAAGDFATGTNHVLPTAGFARTHGAVSVESFGRLVQVQEVTAEGIAGLRPTIEALAQAEGLEGHARAAQIRETTA